MEYQRKEEIRSPSGFGRSLIGGTLIVMSGVGCLASGWTVGARMAQQDILQPSPHAFIGLGVGAVFAFMSMKAPD